MWSTYATSPSLCLWLSKWILRFARVPLRAYLMQLRFLIKLWWRFSQTKNCFNFELRQLISRTLRHGSLNILLASCFVLSAFTGLISQLVTLQQLMHTSLFETHSLWASLDLTKWNATFSLDMSVAPQDLLTSRNPPPLVKIVDTHLLNVPPKCWPSFQGCHPCCNCGEQHNLDNCSPDLVPWPYYVFNNFGKPCFIERDIPSILSSRSIHLWPLGFIRHN